MTGREQERLFEDEVRRVARELWPRAEHDGAAELTFRVSALIASYLGAARRGTIRRSKTGRETLRSAFLCRTRAVQL